VPVTRIWGWVGGVGREKEGRRVGIGTPFTPAERPSEGKQQQYPQGLELPSARGLAPSRERH